MSPKINVGASGVRCNCLCTQSATPCSSTQGHVNSTEHHACSSFSGASVLVHLPRQRLRCCLSPSVLMGSFSFLKQVSQKLYSPPRRSNIETGAFPFSKRALPCHRGLLFSSGWLQVAAKVAKCRGISKTSPSRSIDTTLTHSKHTSGPSNRSIPIKTQ